MQTQMENVQLTRTDLRFIFDEACTDVYSLLNLMTPSFALYLPRRYKRNDENEWRVIASQARLNAAREGLRRVQLICKHNNISQAELDSCFKAQTLRLSHILPNFLSAVTSKHKLSKTTSSSIISADLQNTQRGGAGLKVATFDWLKDNWRLLLLESEYKNKGARKVSNVLKLKWDIALSDTTINKYRNDHNMFV